MIADSQQRNMELANVSISDDTAELLKQEYIRLKNDICDNDKRIEQIRMQNASHVKKLNMLLKRRGTLAEQVRQFADKFAKIYVNSRDSDVEMESLRQLCQKNTDHIRTLTSAISTFNEIPSLPPPTECIHTKTDIPQPQLPTNDTVADARSNAAGEANLKHRTETVHKKSLHKPNHDCNKHQEIRPKVDFVNFINRLDSSGGVSCRKELSRSIHPRNQSKASACCGENRNKFKDKIRPATLTAFVATNNSPINEQNDQNKSPTLRFLYMLMFIVALFSMPMLYSDKVWYPKFGKLFKQTVDEPPIQPIDLTVMEQIRKICGF